VARHRINNESGRKKGSINVPARAYVCVNIWLYIYIYISQWHIHVILLCIVSTIDGRTDESIYDQLWVSILLSADFFIVSRCNYICFTILSFSLSFFLFFLNRVTRSHILAMQLISTCQVVQPSIRRHFRPFPLTFPHFS